MYIGVASASILDSHLRPTQPWLRRNVAGNKLTRLEFGTLSGLNNLTLL